MGEQLRKIVASLGRDYRNRLLEAERAYAGQGTGPKATWVGRYAEDLFMKKDLPRHTGITQAERDPITAVSGKGNPRKLDAAHVLLAGTPISIELKKSDYGGYRSEHQKAAHVLDLGLGTRADRFFIRICGENGIVQVWKREVAEGALHAKGTECSVPLPDVIRFAPDIAARTSRTSGRGR